MAQRWRLGARHGSNWNEIFTVVAPIETPSVLGIGPDGNSLIFFAPKDGAFVERQFNLKNNQYEEPIDPGEYMSGMDRALQRAGKNVTFIKLEGEDHWLSNSETRMQMLQATVAFLEANNPPN